jgi:PleD family two-component response regulator
LKLGLATEACLWENWHKAFERWSELSPKIMIVDDSALSRRTMRRVLETAGYDVVEAADGIAALEMYFIEQPEAVLLDLVMKGCMVWMCWPSFARWIPTCESLS